MDGKRPPAFSGYGKVRISIVLLFVLGILALIGGYYWFGQEQSKPGKSLEKVIIAEASQPVTGLVYVAFKNGYFRNEGLDVILQAHTSGKASLNAVIERKADMATVAETPIMFAVMDGKEICTVATIFTSDKNMAIIARKDREISMPADLKGKRIGVSRGTNGEFFMDSFLIVHGILKNEIREVDLKPEEMVDALTSGKVDAVSTWNPHMAILQEKLGDKAIVFYSEGIYSWTFNIAALKDFANKNPEIVRNVLRSLIEAEKFIIENPGESRRIISEHIKMDEDLLKESWGDYNFRVSLDQSLLTTMEDQARWAIKNRLTDKREVPNYLNFIYLDSLKAVRSEAVTIIR